MKQKRIDISKIDGQIDRSSSQEIRKMMNEFKQLFGEIKKNDMVKKPLCNYIIIRTVSYLENYWKNITRELIDVVGFSTDTLDTKELTISLADIDYIKTNQMITKGRLMIIGFNFQNIKLVDEMISNVIGGEHYFTRILGMREEMSKLIKNEESSGTLLDFNFTELNNLFEMRHQLVHEIDTKSEISPELANKFVINALHFLQLSELLILKIVLERNIEEVKTIPESREKEEMKARDKKRQIILNDTIKKIVRVKDSLIK